MVRVILSNNYDKVHGIMLSLFPSDHVNCKGRQLKFQLDLGCNLAEVSCPVLFLLSDITYFYSNRSSTDLDFSHSLVKKKKTSIQVQFRWISKLQTDSADTMITTLCSGWLILPLEPNLTKKKYIFQLPNNIGFTWYQCSISISIPNRNFDTYSFSTRESVI